LTDEQRLVGNREGLLMEEQRTNLITYSEQFDNAAWSKTGASMSADATIAPDGLTSADAVTEDSGGTSEHKVIQSMTTIAGEIAFTVFVKKKDGGRDWFFIREEIDGSLTNSFYNIEDGTLGAIGSGKIGSIENAGNGWFRVALTQTATAQTSDLSFGIAESDGVYNYTGDGTSGIYVWGAQLEEGSFPSSYIPTAGTQVTRAADDCVRTLGDEFNPEAFTLYIDGVGGHTVSLNEGAVNVYYNTLIMGQLNEQGDVFFSSQNNDVGQFSARNSSASGQKMAVSITNGGEARGYLDGVLFMSESNVLTPNNLRFLYIETRVKGTTSDIQLYPTAFSEAELITLTGGT